MDRYAREIRTSLPEPDGTALANLRHTVAAFEDAPDDRMVVQATAGIYPVGTPGSVTRGRIADTGLTHGDLRKLLMQLNALGARNVFIDLPAR